MDIPVFANLRLETKNPKNPPQMVILMLSPSRQKGLNKNDTQPKDQESCKRKRTLPRHSMYSTNVSCFGVPPKGFQDQQLSSNSSNVQVKKSIQNHLVAIYQHC